MTVVASCGGFSVIVRKKRDDIKSRGRVVIYIPVTCTLGYDVGIFDGQSKVCGGEGRTIHTSYQGPPWKFEIRTQCRVFWRHTCTFFLMHCGLDGARTGLYFFTFEHPGCCSGSPPPLGSHHALWFWGISWMLAPLWS